MGKWFWDKNTSDDDLRCIEDEMRAELDDMDYDSDDYLQLDLERIDVVNEIASRSSGRLSKSEHGWYLSSDD